MRYLKDCVFLIGKIIASFWYFLVGVFMYSRQWKKQERAVKDMDIKFYYKKELKKETTLLSTKEKLRIGKFLKQTPKGERGDFRLYNYLITVVFRPRPDHTLKDAIKDFYLLLHPYMTTYHSSHLYLRRIIKHKNPKAELERLLPTLMKRLEAPNDIFAIAEKKLELHKEIARRIGRKEAQIKEAKRETEKSIDKAMLEEEKKILEERIKQDEQAKKSLEQAISDAEKNPML